jgi:hypothetical protein
VQDGENRRLHLATDFSGPHLINCKPANKLFTTARKGVFIHVRK